MINDKDKDKDNRGEPPPFVCDGKTGGGKSSLSFPDHINQRAIEARGAIKEGEADPPPRSP